jgi:hypothetical protein
MACARRGAKAESAELLEAASSCADVVGRDVNDVVVFGPTNVAVEGKPCEICRMGVITIDRIEMGTRMSVLDDRGSCWRYWSGVVIHQVLR